MWSCAVPQKKKKKKKKKKKIKFCKTTFVTLCFSIHQASSEKKSPLEGKNFLPVSVQQKSIAGRYRHVRVADGPITARYRFIKNASWEIRSV